jgi:hypothetical protein
MSPFWFWIKSFILHIFPEYYPQLSSDQKQNIRRTAKTMALSSASPPVSSTITHATFNLPSELRLMILKHIVPDLASSTPENILPKEKITTNRKGDTKKHHLTKTTKFRALGALCLTSKPTRMEALEVYVQTANKFRLYISIQGKLVDHQNYLDCNRFHGWFPLKLDMLPFFREVEIWIQGCDPSRHEDVKRQLSIIRSLLQGDKVPKVRVLWDAKYTAWKSSHGSLKHYIEVSRQMIEICPKDNHKTRTRWIHSVERPQSGAGNLAANVKS